MSDVFGSSTTTTLSPSFTVSPSIPVSGQTVTFIAAASGGTSPYSYGWNLGGTTKTGNSVSQSFTSGSYTISLTVTDSLGKTATTSKSLTVLLASSGGPAPLYTLSFQGYDFDGANEETLTVNGNQVATIPTALTSSNGATWVSFSFNITSFTVQGTNTISFTHANSDCAVSDQVQNLVVTNQTSTIYSNATVENINTATSCTNTLTYTFTIGPPHSQPNSQPSGGGSCFLCNITQLLPTLSPLFIGLFAGMMMSVSVFLARYHGHNRRLTAMTKETDGQI